VPARASSVPPTRFYELGDHDGPPDIPADAHEAIAGLVALGSSGALILAGTEYGPVRIRVEIHASRPAPADGWEEMAEAEQLSPSGIVSVTEPFAETQPSLPALRIPAGSRYGLRIHANGRTAARLLPIGPQHPAEHHLLQLWPLANQ
jgi:hypothetical protein